ncbi:MAG: response regulator, partial [Nitrospinaceae bacterium]
MTSKILVADDSITIQKIVAMAFENEDATVEGIGDGKKAFERLAEFKPDIVLADLDMPGLTGFELSKKIKESKEFASTRVLLLASDFEEFDEKKFTDSQADDHISKPFKSDDVVQKVKALLGVEPASAAPEEGVLTLAETDMVEETEEKADAAFELSAADVIEEPLPVEEDGAITLSESDMVEEPAPVEEPAIELSSEDLVEEAIPTPAIKSEEESAPIPELEPSLDDMMDSMLKDDLQAEEPVETPPPPLAEPVQTEEVIEQIISPEPEEDVIEEMLEHVESLKESVSPQEPEVQEATPIPDEFIAETNVTGEDNEEELEMEFRGIAKADVLFAKGTAGKVAETVQHVEDIVPEPEDLLERLAPAAHARGKGSPRPDLIRESLSFMSSASEETQTRKAKLPKTPRPSGFPSESNGPTEEQFVQVVGEHVKRLLEKSLETSIETEISGLSKVIAQTVREVVKEITPKI